MGGIIDRLIKKRTKVELKVSEENAFEQFNLFIDHYGLDHLVDKLDILPGSERSQVEVEMELVIDDIRKGYLEIVLNDDGKLEINQHLDDGEIFTYQELDGKCPQMKERYNTTEEKIAGLMGYLSRQGKDVIMKIKRRDLAVTMRIGSFLLTA